MKDDPMPRLDLAPKLNRPLSLWNPWDYLRLLYWVFYFPQALRWYFDIFIDKDRLEQAEKKLSVMSLIISFILLLILRSFFLLFGYPFSWINLVMGVSSWFFIIKILYFYEVNIRLVSGVISSILVGMTTNIFLAIYAEGFSEELFLAGILDILLAGILGFLTFVFISNFVAHFTMCISGGGCRSSEVTIVAAWLANVSIFTLFCIPLLLIVERFRCFLSDTDICALTGFDLGLTTWLIIRLCFWIILFLFLLPASIFILRLDDYFFDFLLRFKKNKSMSVGNVTILPSKKTVSCLGNASQSNWLDLVFVSNELIRYTSQFSCVIGFLNARLLRTGDNQVIFCVSELAKNPWDWNLLMFCSASFFGRLKLEILHNIPCIHLFLGADSHSFFFERRSSSYFIEVIGGFRKAKALFSQNAPLRFDLPYRATAAGFWYLHEKEPDRATFAFEKVRHILYGEEMYTLALTLDRCKQATQFDQIHPLELPPCPERDPAKRLRQDSWPALEAFHRVTQEAQLIHRSHSKATRAQALARAQGELKRILDHADALPQAEGGLILDIATTWRDALLSIASDIGNPEILEPIQNPYTIGDPVEGSRLVGREGILRELESLWLGSANPPSVLVYGHRRMGKTSILRNLTGGSDLKLIYVNLQLLGSVTQGLSEVLLGIADDIAQALEIPAPPDDAFLNFPQRTFERYLREILKQLDCRALIIALDEFETIEKLIESGQLQPDFMGYLRGLIQMDNRLAFALAGLHTLEEMTRDYFEPFFGSTYGIPVSFLSAGATRQILENPSDDFPLEYDPTAVDEIYRLTHGQPYLVQLIGFQLVRHFNEQVFETGRKRDPQLTPTDVATLTDPTQTELFRNGRYYFEGVWKQAAQGAPGQHDILRGLAPHPDGLSAAELERQLSPVANFPEALATLQRHDVIHATEGRWQITVELFRLWVLQQRE